jgi:enoyl-CoA hydratase/carnithine racemase
MENYSTIVLEKQNGIVRLTLNRPEKLNALNEEMYLELGRALDEIERDPTFRVLVIKGAGKAFCAGGDISELVAATTSVEAAQKRLRMSHAVADCIRGIKKPVIVAINGDAIGGGCTLALNGDLRIASEKARFGISFIRVGLSPELGGIYNLPRLVGIGKACELALLGRIIDAREAEKIGLINRLVAANELDAVVNEWATTLAQSSPFTLSLIKVALYKGLNMDFASELENEINIESLCMNSYNGKEGLKAVLEKRQPVFKLD